MLIDEFVEKNPWLDSFEYLDETEDQSYYWNGSNLSYERLGLNVFIEGYGKNLEVLIEYMVTKEGKEIHLLSVMGKTNKFKEYFSDWTSPTTTEMDYYEMVEGYRLPWGEEDPFIYEDS